MENLDLDLNLNKLVLDLVSAKLEKLDIDWSKWPPKVPLTQNSLSFAKFDEFSDVHSNLTMWIQCNLAKTNLWQNDIFHPDCEKYHNLGQKTVRKPKRYLYKSPKIICLKHEFSK